MRDKRELPIREPNRRGLKAVQNYEERTPQRKSKIAGSQDDRKGDIPQPRHRPMAIGPHERGRDGDSTSYHYRGRSGHASKPLSSEEAQKAIRTLLVQVKGAMSFFANFKEEYQREVRGIEAYAGQTILEKLWERKTKTNDSKGRSSKVRSKDDGVGLYSGFDDASTRLWDSLNDACAGATSHPSGQNDSMAKKLYTAINDVGGLLASVWSKSHEMDSLVNELKLLEMMLVLGGAGTASHNDRAKQRPRAHAAGNGDMRDSNPEPDDARYGAMGEDSGCEDNGQHDEQYGEHPERSGGREEMEVGDDGEGQGPCTTD